MTTYAPENQKCSVCGTEVECQVLASTNSRGSPDLDLRPPEMNRSTMHVWLQECPQCGLVNNDLSDTIADAESTIESGAYQALINDPDIPKLARKFARFALLNKHDGETVGKSLLAAAWVCDDAKRPEQAKTYRSRAADHFLLLGPFSDEDPQVSLATMLVDVLRRADRFDESKQLVESIRPFDSVTENEIIAAVLDFEVTLCENGDTDVHTVSEAVDLAKGISS